MTFPSVTKAKTCMRSGWNGSIMEMQTPSQEALGWEEQKPLGKVHPEGQELKESEKQINNAGGYFPGGPVVETLLQCREVQV